MKLIKRKKWPVITAAVIVVIVLMTIFSGIATASPNSHTGSAGEATYLIEIDGISPADITMIQMPVSSVEVIEYQDGDDIILKKRPGRYHCTNLVIAVDTVSPTLNSIWDWFASVKDGRVDRKSISIVMKNSHGEQISQYICLHTWPSEWRIVNLEEQGNNSSTVVEIEVVVEELIKQP
jgi:phage tail-like protein